MVFPQFLALAISFPQVMAGRFQSTLSPISFGPLLAIFALVIFHFSFGLLAGLSNFSPSSTSSFLHILLESSSVKRSFCVSLDHA